MPDTRKPMIIVASKNDDQESFKWFSGGWCTVKNRHTDEAKRLMAIAHKAIDEGGDVQDVIAKLEAAGFEIVRI